MRRWWLLGLVSLGAVGLGRVLPSISTIANFSEPPSGERPLGLTRPKTRKAEAGLEDERAERLIARGIAEDRQGHSAAALDHFQEALSLALHSGSQLSEARALANSGRAARSLGDLGSARSFYEQALAAWDRAGNRAGRLETLQDLALFYIGLGEPARALGYLRQARDIEPDRSSVLHLFGLSFLIAQHDGYALQFLRRALDQDPAGNDIALRARLLGDIGSASLNLGEIEPAAAAFEECLRISLAKDYRPGEAYARAGRGRVLAARGRFDEALAELDRAEEMFRSLGEMSSLSLVLVGKARLERARGNLPAALALSREAIGLIEALRQEIAGPRARAAWLDAWSDPYELQIDLLWHLAGRKPGRGFETAAFEVSERIRARTLYEGLAVPRSASRPETAALERQQGEVTLLLRSLESEKLRLSELSGEEARSRRVQVNLEIRNLVARQGEVEEKLRRSDPRSALAALQPLGLPQVQALLDPGTALLVYTLGVERSFVWWIDQGSLAMYELPPRRQIEATANRIQSLLTQPATRRNLQQVQALLAELSEILLRPVADRLPRARQLAIVPDGALQTLPFTALPRPLTTGLSGEDLVKSYITVVLPSPSTLAALRQREAGRKRPDKLIATIVDPVFGPSDERVARRSTREPPPRFSNLPRLRETAKESQKILALVPPGQGRSILGYDAVPEIFTEPDFRRYRYLHFGSHGVVDSQQPELSGIVLSQLTPEGKPRDGILNFYDVYNLDLPADLVSLSTCRSADGPQIRREGPITMTRSFFYAGASRVLGTLWEVSDRPAARLTAAFYEGVLRDGKRPAEALRDAQDAMGEDGWPPHSWAAFVLQGDWR